MNQLHLIGFVFLLHELDCLVWGKLKPLERQRLLDDLFHLHFYFGQRFRGEGLRRVKVVVKAVIHRRANRQLGIRIQPLDRLRHDMGSRVPEGALALRIVKG